MSQQAGIPDRPAPLRGLFITGTDTGVGKTWVTAAIARNLTDQGVRTGVYKPVCSGAVYSADGRLVYEDVERLAAATDEEFPRERIGPQTFVAPLAPPVAAARESSRVDSELLRSGADWWRGRVELLLVEGAGGLLSPITSTETVADLAAELGLPLVIVAAMRLGAVNHTLLTVEVARQRGLPIAGIVLNHLPGGRDPLAVQTNPALIADFVDVPILARVGPKQPAGLRVWPDGRTIDWLALAGGNPSEARSDN